MKKLSISIILFSLLLLAGCNKNASDINKEQKNSSELDKGNNTADNLNSGGNKAPDFTLISPAGKKVSLSDYKGKVVIVDFWATWCPPCRKGIPDLIDIQTEFGSKVAVIGISVDTDTKDQVASFTQNFNINYTILFATPDVVRSYGNIESIPTSFIIDKNGNIVNQYVGLTPKETYVNEIKKLID
ncbi:MAG: TlpA disulfide reductase family protein [Ignavibacteriaceae bacterium]|jgi:cytochrome c biogenesis protein CcmG/thiol:disulfide interchange protein DsbE